jgi:hypothetical protein
MGLPSRQEVNMTDRLIIEPRVRPGQLHHCGGTVHLKQGQHGRYLLQLRRRLPCTLE